MKKLSDLLLLGDERLYAKSTPVEPHEMILVPNWVDDLHNVMEEIRNKYRFGRAIAAPQLGIMKRLIYMNIERPVIIVNPEIIFKSDKMFPVWDDCMSFPNLLVRVERHWEIHMEYVDLQGIKHEMNVSGDLSELLQHEYDHLEGILSPMRAMDERSFRWRPTPGQAYS